jgi:ketosteroid isomerase-like protein
MVSAATKRAAGLAAAAALACLTVACGEKHDTAADLAEITDFNARYLKSINDGDVETLSRMTDEGHMMVLAGREPISGKAANDAANRRVLEQFDIDETWTPLETVIDRNLAYQRGTWTVASTPKAGGETRHSTGQFVRIYQRLNGSWWMTRDVLLTDPPKAPSSESPQGTAEEPAN